MPQSTPYKRKAQIKRASLAGQKAMHKLDDAAQEQLRQIYQSAADDIARTIAQAGDLNGQIRLQHLARLKADIEQRLQAMAKNRNGTLFNRLNEAAAIGSGAFASVHSAGELSQISDAAVNAVRHFVGQDGLQLSDRLWRIDQLAVRAVADHVQRAVILGHSASQSAQEFLSRGQAVPAEIQQKVGQASAAKIAKGAGENLMKGEMDPYAQAMRVFRTEINRAHGLAYQEAAHQVPDVIGTKFTLSPRHPRPDICDMHARCNRYGLGPGVYPKGKSPWPAHPNTLSFEVVVFKDEVTAEDRAGKQDRISWLNNQPAGVQHQVLGSTAKVAALKRGILKEHQIGTPWKVLKRRYERQGIDITQLSEESEVAA